MNESCHTVKYWLLAKRERRAKELVIESARREENILQYATSLYVMAKIKSDHKVWVWVCVCVGVAWVWV